MKQAEKIGRVFILPEEIDLRHLVSHLVSHCFLTSSKLSEVKSL